MSCLGHLGQLYPLGVISNGNREQQNKKLELTGIQDKFSVVVTSEDAGVCKPSADISLRSMHQSRSKRRMCVFISATDSTMMQLPRQLLGFEAFG